MKSVFKKIVIMGILSFILSFFGCASEQAPKIKPEGDISSISISQRHMIRNECYSFSAYQKNDSYYLEAWCLLVLSEEDYRDVDIHDIPITKEEFDKFSRLDEEYDFFSYITQDKKKKSDIIEVLDDTTTSFTVSYNGESINIGTGTECYQAVYDYFLELTKKYIE